MTIPPHLKRQFPLLFLIMAVASFTTPAILIKEQSLRWQMSLALVLASGGFIHFLYTRHLEETRLFRELFREFNLRYDTLNDSLNKIAMRDAAIPLSDEEVRLLYDYFNLCAEEYYYYKVGYIPAEVWRSWCKGIKNYLDCPNIHSLMSEELKTESYYGLTIKVITKA